MVVYDECNTPAIIDYVTRGTIIAENGAVVDRTWKGGAKCYMMRR